MAELKDYSAEALLAKEREVELDTDDVKEENIEVKEDSKKDNESHAKMEESIIMSPLFKNNGKYI